MTRYIRRQSKDAWQGSLLNLLGTFNVKIPKLCLDGTKTLLTCKWFLDQITTNWMTLDLSEYAYKGVTMLLGNLQEIKNKRKHPLLSPRCLKHIKGGLQYLIWNFMKEGKKRTSQCHSRYGTYKKKDARSPISPIWFNFIQAIR